MVNHGTITITLKHNIKDVDFTVSDTGKGMTKEDTNPQTGYTLDGSTNSPTAKPKRGNR